MQTTQIVVDGSDRFMEMLVLSMRVGYGRPTLSAEKESLFSRKDFSLFGQERSNLEVANAVIKSRLYLFETNSMSLVYSSNQNKSLFLYTSDTSLM